MNISEVQQSVEDTTHKIRDLATAIQDRAQGGGAKLNEKEVSDLIKALGNLLQVPWEVMDRLTGYREDAPDRWEEHVEDFSQAAKRGTRIRLREGGGNPDAVDLNDY